MVQPGEIASGSAKLAMPRVVVRWILCLLVAFAFVMVGGMKLVSRPRMVQEFNQVGLGQRFRFFIGTLEVIGGLGLLVPKFSRCLASPLTVLGWLLEM
jgi:uncharacterized membrane protein YphA (DoxX/SURF4 family)